MKQLHKCWIWKGLWGLAALAFVFALVTTKTNSMIFGIAAGQWYLNALVLGLLTIPIKLDCQACDSCRA